jgi:hypothetical protein
VASISTTTCPPSRVPAVPASGRRRDQTRSRAAARAERNAATAASVMAALTANAANNRDTVGSEATTPTSSRCARTAATSAKQSPPSATAIATSSNTLPGSWRARAGRHGISALVNAERRPATRIVSFIINAPDDVTNDSRPSSRTSPPTALLFTYGVPSSSEILRLCNPRIPCRTGTSVHYTPSQPPTT